MFARLEGVEPTNNGTKRALRLAVPWRKGSFGSDSEAGSRFAESAPGGLTVAATCWQQDRRLLDLLVAAGKPYFKERPRRRCSLPHMDRSNRRAVPVGHHGEIAASEATERVEETD